MSTQISDDRKQKTMYVIKHVDLLSKKDRLQILFMLNTNVKFKGCKLVDGSDGCRVSMDRMTDDAINMLHSCVTDMRTVPKKYRI